MRLKRELEASLMADSMMKSMSCCLVQGSRSFTILSDAGTSESEESDSEWWEICVSLFERVRVFWGLLFLFFFLVLVVFLFFLRFLLLISGFLRGFRFLPLLLVRVIVERESREGVCVFAES